MKLSKVHTTMSPASMRLTTLLLAAIAGVRTGAFLVDFTVGAAVYHPETQRIFSGSVEASPGLLARFAVDGTGIQDLQLERTPLMGRFTSACLVNETGDVAFGTGLVGSRTGGVVLIGPSGKPKGGLQLLAPPLDSVTALAAGPNSSLIFVGTAGGRLAVLDTATGRFGNLLIFPSRNGSPAPVTVRGILVLRALNEGGGFLLQASGYESDALQWNNFTDPARARPGDAIVFDPSTGLARHTPVAASGGIGPRSFVASSAFLIALNASGVRNGTSRADQRLTGGPGIGLLYSLRQGAPAAQEPTLSILGDDVFFRTALPGVPSCMDPAMAAYVQGSSSVPGGVGTSSRSIPFGGNATVPVPAVNFMPLLGTSPSLTVPAGAGAMLVEVFNASGRLVGSFSIRGDDAGVFGSVQPFVGSLVASTGTLPGPPGTGIQSACMAPEHMALLDTPAVLCAAINASEFATLRAGDPPTSPQAVPLVSALQWEPPKGLSSSIGLGVTAPGASSELAALLPSTIAVTAVSHGNIGGRMEASYSTVFLSSGRNNSMPRRWAGAGRTSLAGPAAAAGSGAVTAFPVLINNLVTSTLALLPQAGTVLPQFGMLMSSVFVDAASLPGRLSNSLAEAGDIAAAEGAALQAGANTSTQSSSLSSPLPSPSSGEASPKTVIHQPPTLAADGAAALPPYDPSSWPKAFAFMLVATPMQATALPLQAAVPGATPMPPPTGNPDPLAQTPLLVQAAVPGGTVIRARTLTGLPPDGPFPFVLAPGGSSGGAGGSGGPALMRDIFQDGSSRSVAVGTAIFKDAATPPAVVAGWGTAYFAGGSMLAAVDLNTLSVTATCSPGLQGGTALLTAGVLHPYTSLKVSLPGATRPDVPIVTAYFATAEGSISMVADLTTFCAASPRGFPDLLAAINPSRDGGLSFAIGLMLYRPPVNATLVAARAAAGLPALAPVDYVLALLRGGTAPGDLPGAGIVAVPMGGNASDSATFGIRITPPTGDPRPQILNLPVAAPATSFALDPTFGHVMVTTEAAPSTGVPQLIRASLNVIAPYAGIPSGRPVVWPQKLAGVGNTTSPADIACVLPLAGGLPPNASSPGLGRLLAITRRVPASSDTSDYETVDATIFSLDAPATGGALQPASGAPMLSTRSLRLSTALPPGIAAFGTVASLLGDWSRPSAAACRTLVADAGAVLAGSPMQLQSLYLGAAGFGAFNSSVGVVRVGSPPAGAGSSAVASSRLRRQLQSSPQSSPQAVVADAAQVGVANTTLLSIDAAVWLAQAALPVPATPVPSNNSGSNSSGSGAAGGTNNAEEEQLDLVIYILAGAAAALLVLATGICCGAGRKVRRARADIRADASRAVKRVRTADALLRHEAAGTAESSPAILDGLALGLTTDALLPPLRPGQEDDPGRPKRSRSSSGRNSSENIQARVQVIVADVATELLSPIAREEGEEQLAVLGVSEGETADDSFEHAVSSRGGAAPLSARRPGAASPGRRASVAATVQRVQRNAVAAFASSLPRGTLEALVNDVLQRAACVLADPIRLRAAFATAIAEDLLLERLVAAAVAETDADSDAAIEVADSSSAAAGSSAVTKAAARRSSSTALPQAAILNAVVRACSEELLASLSVDGTAAKSTAPHAISVPASAVEALHKLDRRLWRASSRHCLPLGASSIAASSIAVADASSGARTPEDSVAAHSGAPKTVDAPRSPSISLSTPAALPRATRRVLEFAPISVDGSDGVALQPRQLQSGLGAASAALSRALEEVPVRVGAMPIATRRAKSSRGSNAGSSVHDSDGAKLAALASAAADQALTGASNRPSSARISNPQLRLQQQALLLASLAPESADTELTADRPRAVLAEGAAAFASRVKAAKALIESRLAAVQLRRDLVDTAQRLAASLRGDGVGPADSFASSASAAAVDGGDDTDDDDDDDDWAASGLVVSVEEGVDSETALGETPRPAHAAGAAGSRGSMSSALSGMHRHRSPAAAVRSGAIEKVDVNMRSAARTGVASRARAPAISRASALPSLALEAVVLSTLQGAAAASRRTLLRYLDGDDAGAAALLAEADAESDTESDTGSGTPSRSRRTSATATAAGSVTGGGHSPRASRAITRESIAAAIAVGLPASEAAGFQRVSFAALQQAGLRGWDGVWRFACPCACAGPADADDDVEMSGAGARDADHAASAAAAPLRQSSSKAAARRTSSAGRRRNLPPLLARHTAARFAQRLRGRQLAYVHQKRASFAPGALGRPHPSGAGAGGRHGAPRRSLAGNSRASAAAGRTPGGSGDGIELSRMSTASAQDDGAAADGAIGTRSPRGSSADAALSLLSAGATVLPPALAAPLLFHRLHAAGAIPGFEGFLGAPADPSRPVGSPGTPSNASASSAPLPPHTGRGDNLSLTSPNARRKTQSGFAPLISLGSSAGELPLSATVANPMLLHRGRDSPSLLAGDDASSPSSTRRSGASAGGLGASRRRLRGSDSSNDGAAASVAAPRTPSDSAGSRASFAGGASFAPLSTNRAAAGVRSGHFTR